MNKQTKTNYFSIMIILGVMAIIFSIINAIVIEVYQGAAVIPLYVTWGLTIVQLLLLVYVVFTCNLNRANLFWILVLSLGPIIIGIRQLLILNKQEFNEEYE